MHEPAPASAKRHQPKKKLINIRRGEGGEEWQGGPLWSPNRHQPKQGEARKHDS